MKKLEQKLYYQLPIWAKSIAASFHGWRLNRWRIGRYYREELYTSAKRETWNHEQIEKYQHERLADTLRDALKYVPWYREHVSVKPEELSSENAFEALADFPILLKHEIQSGPEQFIDERYSIPDLYEEHTSGTTGTPLKLWSSPEMVQRWHALAHRRWLSWAGVSPKDRWAIFGGQLILNRKQNKPPYWVMNHPMRQCYFSVYHLSPKTVQPYLEQLKKIQPIYIMGYPSALEGLVNLAKEAGLSWKENSIKVVITNAEPLFPWQKERISDFLNCRVVETYGASEGVFMGAECTENRLHLCPDVGVWEILDQEYRPVPEDTMGQFICTGFFNQAMPLIRYRTGDAVSISSEGCECGCSFPIIRRIEGRVDDMIILPNGEVIGRMDPVFKADFPIREAQIIQKALENIEVLVVPTRNFSDQTISMIRQAISDRLGNQVSIEVFVVDEIPRSANGKFRTVRSLLN